MFERRKVYSFCNINHNTVAEWQCSDHPIIAMDDTGKLVGSWVSSSHSWGQQDILRGIKGVDYEYEVEWVEHPHAHPVLSRLL